MPKSDLSNQLIHLNHCSKSIVFYDTCDLVCIPSLHTVEEGPEGIPVVLIEAAYRKIPVIATDCGAISEVIPNKYLVKADAESFAKAIKLYRHKKLDSTEILYKNAERNHNRENINNLYKIFIDSIQK